MATETDRAGVAQHQGRGLRPPGTCERKGEMEKEFKVPQKLLARVNYSFF